MKNLEDARHPKQYVFPLKLHEKLQRLANERTHGNRSRMAEELIEAGILAIIHPKPTDKVAG